MNSSLILGTLIAFVGVFSLSEATRGVGFLSVAVLLAIFARIQQAHDHTLCQRLDSPPSLIVKPSQWAFALLVLLALCVLALSVAIPIFDQAAELQRFNKETTGR